jgi:hypothetical protein
MKFFPKKIFKKKAPIIIGAILALVASVIIVGAIENSFSGGSAIKVISAQNVF